MLGQLHTWMRVLYDIVLPPSAEYARVARYTADDLPVVTRLDQRSGTPVTVLWDYDNPRVRDVIWALKYRKSAHAAELCAQALAEYLQDVVSEAQLMQDTRECVVIPIPLSKERVRMRGFNQIELVLNALVRSKQLPALTSDSRTLVRIRNTPPQTTLKRAQRLTNVRGAFMVESAYAERLKRACVFIVDDVTTTGATLHEAAMTLKKAGIHAECIALAQAGW